MAWISAEGGAHALAQSHNLRGLKHLDLSDNGLIDEGVQALADSENLKAVEHLNLADNFLREAGAKQTKWEKKFYKGK